MRFTDWKHCEFRVVKDGKQVFTVKQVSCEIPYCPISFLGLFTSLPLTFMCIPKLLFSPSTWHHPAHGLINYTVYSRVTGWERCPLLVTTRIMMLSKGWPLLRWLGSQKLVSETWEQQMACVCSSSSSSLHEKHMSNTMSKKPCLDWILRKGALLFCPLTSWCPSSINIFHRNTPTTHSVYRLYSNHTLLCVKFLVLNTFESKSQMSKI